MRGFILPLVCAFLSGCVATDSTRSTSLNPERGFGKRIVNTTLDSITDAEIEAPASISKARRNSIIQARLAEIDILYHQYERQLSVDIRNGRFGFSLAELLVGTAGTLTSSTRGSQNLSAVSAILSGSEAAYERDVLLEQTLQALVSQMRANRNTIKVRIVERYDSEPENYTLQMALSDLAAYEQAGSVASAVAGITESATEQRRESEDDLVEAENDLIIEETIRTQNFGQHGRSIAQYPDAGTFPVDQNERFQILNDCYVRSVENSDSVSLGEFIPIADSDAEASERIEACMRDRYQINIGGS